MTIPSAPAPTPEPAGPALAEPPADAAADAVPGSPQRRGFLLLFVLAWFGIGLATATIGAVAIPKALVMLDEASKETNLSLAVGLGGIVVIVTTPLFGRMSDRTMSRLGKRRPWILGGALVGFLGVLLLAFAPSVPAIIAGWAVVQAGFGAANAAVHALLADQIPGRIRARVAAAASASAALALIAGAAIVASLPSSAPPLWFLVPGGIGTAFSLLLFFGLRDIVRTERPAPLRASDVLATYWLDPVRYRDFFWAWTCRLLVTMSIVSVSAYLLFFIIDHLGISKEEATGVQATALAAFTVGNILMALLFGWISDATGRRKPIIWISCALSAIGLLIAILAPGVGMFLVGIAVVGAAQGAYISVDVALMTEVLPTFEEAGKDLGIVALSYQLPQFLVPVLAVPLLATGGGENYTALYTAAIVLSVLGGLAVLPVKSVR